MTDAIVVSLFPDRSGAEAAIRDLKKAGFSDEQIGVAMQDAGSPTGRVEADPGAVGSAAEGALGGGLLGGLVGLLGSLLVPGIGPVVLGGILASTLAGAGIGAATGGLIGILVGMGVPEREAEHLDRGLRAGGVLLAVSAASRAPEALAIIQRHQPQLGITSNASLDQAGLSQPPERRSRDDTGYSGPERRLVQV